MFFRVTELWGAHKRHAFGFYFLCGETVWYQVSAKLEDHEYYGGGGVSLLTLGEGGLAERLLPGERSCFR